MKSLYINSSLNSLQICFKDGDKVQKFLSDGGKSQSEEIFDAINSVLGGVEIADLDFIVAVTGPGSFTGIRLGLSIIKGFLIATGVPVICMNNFDAMYCSVKDKGYNEYNIAFDAGGKDCYFARLDKNGVSVMPYGLMLKTDLPDGIITDEIDAVKVLKCVEEGFDKKTFVQNGIEPLYIKPHYAKVKRELAE